MLRHQGLQREGLFAKQPIKENKSQIDLPGRQGARGIYGITKKQGGLRHGGCAKRGER